MARVSCWMVAQSSSLSKTWRGSPGPAKRAKRVPPVPTPQVGTATPKAAISPTTPSMSLAGAGELALQRAVVVLVGGERAGVLLGDQRVGYAVGHARLAYLVNDWALPASTLRMLPVDFADRSEAKK